MVAGGNIKLDGQAISGLSGEAIRRIRGRRIGFIFQDPMTSLNPLLTIETQMVETIMVNLGLDKATAYEKSIELLTSVEFQSQSYVSSSTLTSFLEVCDSA